MYQEALQKEYEKESGLFLSIDLLEYGKLREKDQKQLHE